MSDERATPIARWKDNPYAADLGDMDVMTALTEGARHGFAPSWIS